MDGLLQFISKRLLNKDTVTKRDNVKPYLNSVPNTSVESDQNTTEEEKIVFDRTDKPEVTETNEDRENYLIGQIEEFREKAYQLEELLLTKETKVVELQNMVDESEVKTQELQVMLDERQREAEYISQEVTEQIDQMIANISIKINEIKEDMCSELESGRKFSEERSLEIQERLEAVKGQLEDIKSEVTEKIHTENVKCYRNVVELFKGVDLKLDKFDYAEGKLISMNKTIIMILVLASLNMFGLVSLILYVLNII